MCGLGQRCAHHGDDGQQPQQRVPVDDHACQEEVDGQQDLQGGREEGRHRLGGLSLQRLSLTAQAQACSAKAASP